MLSVVWTVGQLNITDVNCVQPISSMRKEAIYINEFNHPTLMPDTSSKEVGLTCWHGDVDCVQPISSMGFIIQPTSLTPDSFLRLPIHHWSGNRPRRAKYAPTPTNRLHCTNSIPILGTAWKNLGSAVFRPSDIDRKLKLMGVNHRLRSCIEENNVIIISAVDPSVVHYWHTWRSVKKTLK